jgi:hypothetical protein
MSKWLRLAFLVLTVAFFGTILFPVISGWFVMM